ncbi:MAG: Hsp70 family protein, partial [Sulfuritalea sp.]|nr:Hsp70 family protein [Sulfuritalea sp.]
LDEIKTTLPSEGRAAGEVVRVVAARVTEAGNLEPEAMPHDGSARWKVEFDVRGGAPN